MVYLFLADGFEEIEGLCVLDFLRRAGVEVTTVGVSGKIANGSHKIPVVCDITENELDTSSDFDMVILPGGLPGSNNLDNSLVVDKMIKDISAYNTTIRFWTIGFSATVVFSTTFAISSFDNR